MHPEQAFPYAVKQVVPLWAVTLDGDFRQPVEACVTRHTEVVLYAVYQFPVSYAPRYDVLIFAAYGNVWIIRHEWLMNDSRLSHSVS